MNGYSEERWTNSFSMRRVATDFVDWLKLFPDDLTWAGSNVLGFDLPFLRSDFARCDVPFPEAPKFGRRTLNTESLCFPLRAMGLVDSCGVAALRKWAGCDGEQHHSALDDVLDTVLIIRTYFERYVWPWGEPDSREPRP